MRIKRRVPISRASVNNEVVKYIDEFEGKHEKNKHVIWAMALLYANSLDPITEEQFQVYIGDNFFRAKKKRRELGILYNPSQ